MTTTLASDGQLFDMLHETFGIGDFDDSQGEWFRFRMTEIAKLKAIRKRRQVSIADMTMTAAYCKRHSERIHETWQLLGFIADAKREARRTAVPELSQQMREALEQERSTPGADSEKWIERLLLARGPHRRTVLQEWKSHRENREES